MPHRRPKPSLVLGAVAALAVASPLAVYGFSSAPSEIRSTNETTSSVISTDIAQVVLAQVPDIVIPLKELTGLDLPDVNIGELRNLKLPPSIQIPSNLQLPGGIRIPDLQIPLQLPGPGDVSDPAILPPTDQPGAIVKELSRDTPFSLVALTSATVASAESKIRALQSDGTWGEWFSPDRIDTGSTDGKISTGKVATEPIYVGLTKAIQILTPEAAPVPATLPASVPAAESAAPLGYTPASLSTPLRRESALTAADEVTAVLIEPGSGPADSSLSDIATPVAGTGPRVITRAQWGADESLRCSQPTYDDSLGGAIVHHTAGNNNYSKAESAGIVRAIYSYHAQTLGWCDIGYNALVDRYGQIFEGRAGGLDRPVQGAHAGGFNENTTGVAMMGDFSSVSPPQATIDSVGKFLGWKLGKAGLDPLGRTTMYSEGTEFTPYAQGTAVSLPIIFAHRDVGNTTCPGDAGYARLGEIRQIAAANTGGNAILASGPSGGSTSPTLPGLGAGTGSSLGAGVPDLVTELLRLTDSSPVVQKWIAEGGDTGRLGRAVTGLLQAKAGQTAAEFANGAIFTSPNGGVWTVLGEIFKSWQKLGADTGELGLPTSDEYPVPGGLRADFENGSLIFNQITGIVTTVLKTYNDTYAGALNSRNPVDTALPADPAPVPTPVG